MGMIKLKGKWLSEDTRCVVCGEKLTKVVRDDNGKLIGVTQNHHCDPKVINNIEATRASVDERETRTRPYYERLYDGLKQIETTQCDMG